MRGCQAKRGCGWKEQPGGRGESEGGKGSTMQTVGQKVSEEPFTEQSVWPSAS